MDTLDNPIERTQRINPWRRLAYGVIAFLILVVFVLSLVQLWFIYTTADVPGFGNILPDERGLPREDQRGAFLLLKEDGPTNNSSPLIQLLATTQPGVVDTQSGAHLLPDDLESVYIQSAAVSEGMDYRVYRIGEAELDEMSVERQPGGKSMVIRPADATWDPGAYIVDIPSDGMFGGRTYFQFYIDEP